MERVHTIEKKNLDGPLDTKKTNRMFRITKHSVHPANLTSLTFDKLL